MDTKHSGTKEEQLPAADTAPRTRMFAEVHLLDIPYHLDKPYTYALGSNTSLPAVAIGTFVYIPFGNANRTVMGLVTALKTEAELPADLPPEKCKNVLRAVSEEFTLGAETVRLCFYMKEMTFCTVGEAAATVIPMGALRFLVEKYELITDAVPKFHKRYDGAACPEQTVFSYIEARGNVRCDVLRRNLGTDCAAAAERMYQNGYLRRFGDIAERTHRAETVFLHCSAGCDEMTRLLAGDPVTCKKYKCVKIKDDRYPQILHYLLARKAEPVEMTVLINETGLTAPFVKALVRGGFLYERREERFRNPYLEACHKPPCDENLLNEEQKTACDSLVSLYRTGKPQAALLHGVTGSGKTRVIKAVMDEVLASGRQVIMLIPEIALTPQSVALFCAFYGEQVAVVHSELTPAERLDVWQKAKKGLVNVVIGTRSAVFTPLPRLGMIVIDEEQEHTYKSDRNPKYHARDIARYRCAESGALMLLASATPSFESYYKAEKGIYTLVELHSRYGSAQLPRVVMADLHDDPLAANDTPLGNVLSDALQKTVAQGNQAVFFINRRGYQKYLLCLACRETVLCPHCSVPLSLHFVRTDMNEERKSMLICHYCGYRSAPLSACPSCGSEHLRAFGYGTQRAEDTISVRYPHIRTIRMDADTTSGKNGHETIVSKFRNKEADVLLGTQMVTKGHDFPDVTLVGVLSADALLYADDFRASEKAFSLITQVVGRAGRGDKPGVAVIQTYNPENEILKLAARQDYRAFYQSAIRLRQSLVFPPFCDMVLIVFSADEESEVNTAAAKFASRLTALNTGDGAFSDVPLAVFGPFEAQIYKLNDKFRIRLVLKCRLNKRTRALLDTLMREAGEKFSDRVSVSIDVNPDSI